MHPRKSSLLVRKPISSETGGETAGGGRGGRRLNAEIAASDGRIAPWRRAGLLRDRQIRAASTTLAD
jgi:hypothetical protein